MKAITQAYIEAALWASTDDDGDSLNHGEHELSDSFKLEAAKDCESFLELCKSEGVEPAGDDDQTGHDFFLTRNGHGAGFWDRGYGQVGDDLTKIAKSFGESDLYVGDDGLVYA